MALRATGIMAAALLALASLPLYAADLPPMAGIEPGSAAALERAGLFAELKAAKDDAEARAVEDKIWKFWRSFADAQSRELLEESRQSQLRFDYDEALLYQKELVKHQPRFAEGWNQLGYVYFLAGNYDASLAAIERTLELEPMHYAALAGKGIIFVQQGKEAEAQAPLKAALKINPWLKERNLIGKDAIPQP